MQKLRAILRKRAAFLAVVVCLCLAAAIAFVALRGTGLGDAGADRLASLHATFNLVEGCVWIAAGGFVLLRRCASPPALRAPLLAAGLAFLAFGPTDFVEIRTGAWYEPWWLLAWKAACVLALLGSCRWYVVRRRVACMRRVRGGTATTHVPLDHPSPPG